MGNCLKKQFVIEDSLRLLDHNYDVVHEIETIKEDLVKTNNNITNLNNSTNNNFELISQDILKLKNTIKNIKKFNEEMFYHYKTIHFQKQDQEQDQEQTQEQNQKQDQEHEQILIDYEEPESSISTPISISRSIHQVEYKYGGLIPEISHDDLAGPAFTVSSISPKSNALL